jgi:hypothetical protein
MFTERHQDKNSSLGKNPFSKPAWQTAKKLASKKEAKETLTLDELLEMKHTLPG